MAMPSTKLPRRTLKKILDLYEKSSEIEWEAQHLFCGVLISLMKSMNIAENELIYVKDEEEMILFRAYYSNNTLTIRYMCDDSIEGYYDCFSDDVLLGIGTLMQLFDFLMTINESSMKY